MLKKSLISISILSSLTLFSFSANAAPADDLAAYLNQSVGFYATYKYTSSDGQTGNVNIDVLRPNNFIWTYTSNPRSKTISNGSVIYIETYSPKNAVTKMSASAYPYWDEPYVLFSRNNPADWANYTITEEAYTDTTKIPKLKFTLTPLSNQNRNVRSFTVVFENTTPFQKNYISQFTTYYDNGAYVNYQRLSQEGRTDGSNGTDKYNVTDSYYKGWIQTGF